MKIKLLDASVANKIAAGEVVERPASIVKELVENSIDAGATNVTVEIKGGGIELIRITDNGCGMAEDDVKNAFLRHATSKIAVAEDLNDILTLGFRGEALASIAAVSKVQLTTRTANSDEGTQIELSGGNIERFFPCGCAEGTSISVKELFFNTPARRKFLKKPTQEASYIQETVHKLALSNPNVSIRFAIDGKNVLRTPGDGQLLSAIRAVFGQEVAVNMIPIDKKINGIGLNGYIGKREIQRNNRSRQILFINGRSVKNDMISAAVQEAYAGRLNIGKFPFFVLQVSVDTALVDVNVHPTKQEVRFQEGLPVYSAVLQMVSTVLKENQEIPSLFKTEITAPASKVIEVEAFDIKKAAELNNETVFNKESAVTESIPTAEAEEETEAPVETFLTQRKKATPAIKEAQKIALAFDFDDDVLEVNDAPFAPIERALKAEATAQIEEKPVEQQEIAVEQSTFLTDDETEYKLCGVLFDTYIILEAGDEGYIIDQHAAHERILFEKLYKEMEGGASSQLLLMPQMIKVTPQESAVLEDILPRLVELGFEIDDMGYGSLAVKAVPSVLDGCNSERFISEILDESASFKSLRTNELKRSKLMQMACKSAVKAGDKLTESEIKFLLRLIKTEGIPLSCPHGRPILIRLTRHELEVRFKRIQ